MQLNHHQRYRRRRRVVGVAALAAAASMLTLQGWLPAFWSGPPPAGASGPPGRSYAAVHVVKPGDTLWAIAVAAHPHADPRPLVDRLVAELHGRPLQVGQAVEVP